MKDDGRKLYLYELEDDPATGGPERDPLVDSNDQAATEPPGQEADRK